MTDTLPTIAVLGGTGAEGSGLAFRWANAGHKVLIGGRDGAKSAAAAADLNTQLGRDAFTGLDNAAAAQQGEIIVLTVPFAVQQATAQSVAAHLDGKILIDVTVPLVPPKVSRVQLPNGGSAVEALQKLLGPGVKVVSAFQNVSAHHLKDLSHPVGCDVLVCGDDSDAVETVIGLAKEIGAQAWHAGPLANSVVAEGLTSVLIGINRRYKTPSAGIMLTNIPGGGASGH